MNTFIKVTRRRTEQRAETRARLLAAARELFSTRGFEETGLRDVARKAGVAVGTVFVHFPDKGALLEAALDEQLEQVLAAAGATLPPTGGRAAVDHLVVALFRAYAASPALARAFIAGTLFQRGGVTEARLQAFLAGMAGLVATPGLLAPGLAPEEAAEALFAAYFAALVGGLRADVVDAERMLVSFRRLSAPCFAPPTRSPA